MLVFIDIDGVLADISNHTNYKLMTANDWESLPTTRHFNVLLALSDYVVTAPTDTPEYYAGRKKWHSRHCPQKPLIICKDKFLLATPNRLLVDDYQPNIEKWEDAGGTGILWTQNNLSEVLNYVH